VYPTTVEMKSFFKTRTKRHIDLVKKYWDKIQGLVNTDGRDIQLHDNSKFLPPEFIPYIHLTWMYKTKGSPDEYIMPDSLARKVHEATFHHVMHNDHHPEYWDSSILNNPVNFEDRDAHGGVVIDAREMPEDAIAEMCSDWMAMSEEKGNSPIDWARANIPSRWKFSDDQEKLIYRLLKAGWTKRETGSAME